MPGFEPRDPNYALRVTDCYRNESAAFRWGGQLISLAPGRISIVLPMAGNPGFSSESPIRSYVAGLLDDACLLASLSLTSAGDSVVMAEYKLNFLAPASGENLVARADVVRPGRSITVCRADALVDGRLSARMLATLAIYRSG